MKKWIVAFLSFCMLLGIAACGAEKTENIPMPENKSEEPAANVETTPVTEAGAEKPEDSSTDQSGSGFVWNYALMGKLISTSFFGFIWNTIRHCTSDTGSKCREETATRLSGAAVFPAIKTAVGPFDPPGCPWASPILG